MTKQNQKAGDNSTNIQASTVIINEGLTSDVVREVFRDLFEANFQKMAGEAIETAKRRGDFITEKILEALIEENPEGLGVARDPDFQHAVFTVQKEYARTGDEELGALLVDLLVSRSKYGDRSFQQIVLNEALEKASKLTERELTALSLVLLLRNSGDSDVINLKSLGDFFDKFVYPFTDKLPDSNLSLLHIDSIGCGAIDYRQLPLQDIIRIMYQGLFSIGFDTVEVRDRKLSIGIDDPLFGKCESNPEKMQIESVTKAALQDILDERKLSEHDAHSILGMFDHYTVNSDQVMQTCVQLRPYMDEFFKTFSETGLGFLKLTTVGMAIAHANIRRHVGDFTEFSEWVPST